MLQTEYSRFTGEVCGSEKPIEPNERSKLSREYYAHEMDMLPEYASIFQAKRIFTLQSNISFGKSSFFFDGLLFL